MSEKKGCRDPNPKTLRYTSSNNLMPMSLVADDDNSSCRNELPNANYVTARLAKKVTVRRNSEVIIMFLQDLQRENNDQHKSTQKAIADLKGLVSKLLEIKESAKIAKREAVR